MKLRAKNYFVILVISLLQFLLAFGMYQVCFRELRTNAHTGNLRSLSRCQEIIDQNYYESIQLANRMMKTISMSPLLATNSPYLDASTVMTVRAAQESIADPITQTSMVNDIFLFIDHPNVVISPSLSYLSYEKFYQDYFNFDNYDYPQFLEEVIQGRRNKIIYSSVPIRRLKKTDNNIVISLRYPMDPGLSQNGRALILLSENEISKLISGSYLENHGAFFVADEQGNVLFSVNHELDESLITISDTFQKQSGGVFFHKNGEDYITSYIKSPTTGWHYVGIMNQKDVMLEVRGLQWFFTATIIISLSVSFLTMFFLLFRFNQSIRTFINGVYSAIGTHHQPTNNLEAEQVNAAVRVLVEDRARLQERIKKHIPLLNNTFAYRLLKQDFRSEQELQDTANQLGIEISDFHYVVIGAYFSMSREDIPSDDTAQLYHKEEIKLVLTDYISSQFQFSLTHTATSDYLFFIIGDNMISGSNARAELTAWLQRVCLTFTKQYQCIPLFTIGRIYKNLLDTALSYQDIHNVLTYRAQERESNILWYDDVLSYLEGYSYPLDTEKQLMYRLTLGEEEAVTALIDKLSAVNITERKLTVEMGTRLMREMVDTLNKHFTHMTQNGNHYPATLESEISALEKSSNLDIFYQNFKSICLQICELNKAFHAESRTSQIIREILEYICKHYNNAELNLDMVAMHFGFTSSYLSRAFKEHTGETFSSQLRAIRIQAACTLLMSNENIEIVAQQVGYFSSNSFRVSFKNVTGMTPSQYRNKQRKDAVNNT